MNNKRTNQQRRSQWREALETALAQPEEPLLVERFNDGWGWNTSARPVSVRCINKRTYIIKGQQASRQIVNDQIIARLGIALGAPVGCPQIVEISPDLLEIDLQYNYLTPGTAHGSLFIEGCDDNRDLNKFYTDQAENIPRFASLCVLYGWVLAQDHQFIFEKKYPNRVYSVDHGHFFPKRPNWTQETLCQASAAELDTRLARACFFSRESPEIRNALEQLDQVSEDIIIQAVAAPPDEWGLTDAVSSGLMFPGDEESEIPKHERLIKIARGWRNSIQFTEPHGSLAPVDKLLKDTVEDFLIEPCNSCSLALKSSKDILKDLLIVSVDEPRSLSYLSLDHGRNRQLAVKVTTSSVKEAFKNWLGQENQKQAKNLIKQKYELDGKREKFKFDVAIANGSPYLVAQGLSFEVYPQTKSLQALSWSIQNVKNFNKDLPIGVVTLPPKEEDSPGYLERQRIYEQSTAIYSDLGADILQEDQVADWLEQKLNPIKTEILELVHQK